MRQGGEPQGVQVVRQGEPTPYHCDFNPLYLKISSLAHFFAMRFSLAGMLVIFPYCLRVLRCCCFEASPVSGLGGKMGLDATNKWPGETDREWGRVIKKDPAVTAKIDEIWGELGL